MRPRTKIPRNVVIKSSLLLERFLLTNHKTNLLGTLLFILHPLFQCMVKTYPSFENRTPIPPQQALQQTLAWQYLALYHAESSVSNPQGTTGKRNARKLVLKEEGCHKEVAGWVLTVRASSIDMLDGIGAGSTLGESRARATRRET
jgi:hypothetical protein